MEQKRIPKTRRRRGDGGDDDATDIVDFPVERSQTTRMILAKVNRTLSEIDRASSGS